MANPQAENGHVDIANEIVEALCKCFPGFTEGQLIWAILRKTYGWHKKEDSISLGQLCEMTGKSRRMVIYSLQNLEAKKMITIKRQRGRGIKNEINSIAFQKNYDLWVVQEKSNQYSKILNRRKELYLKYKDEVVQENEGSARNDNLVVQEMEKDSQFLAPTKETITKENTKETNSSARYPKDFLVFYEYYPKKKGKEAALKAWNMAKKKGILPTIELIIQAIKTQKEEDEDWSRDGGQFIPHPATWLNQGRWDDKPIPWQEKVRMTK